MTASITVVGAGSWGTTLAMLAAGNGHATTLVARDPETARRLGEARVNERYLPGIALPSQIDVASDPREAVSRAEVVVLAVPVGAMREAARQIAPALRAGVVVSVAKGLEQGSLLRMTEVLAEELSGRSVAIAALSGPNLAREIAAGRPAASVVASRDRAAAATVAACFQSSAFRVYTSDDPVGVELGGSLKNVVAIATGIGDGLGMGDNAKAALVTRGLAEMTRLGAACGGNPLTFAGLSGLGDLVATCVSPLSRNRRVGLGLGEGRSLAEALAALGQVAEGVWTAPAAVALGKRHGVELPIAEQVAAVLAGERTPVEAMRRLMEREQTRELWGIEPGG